MGSAILCQFYTCKAEVSGYCTRHRHLLPAIQRVVDHHDPEGICSFNVNVSNLLPMVKVMEEQYRNDTTAQEQKIGCDADIARRAGCAPRSGRR